MTGRTAAVVCLLAVAVAATGFGVGLHGAAPPAKAPARAGHWPQWRGPDRLNLSPDRGLRKAWPKEGPPLAWQVNGIGQGVGPVAVADGKVYVLGHREGYEHLTCVEEATGRPY